MKTSSRNHSTMLSFVVALAFFCVSQQVQAFTPSFSLSSHAIRKASTPVTQLSMAWSLPAPVQKTLLASSSYWYQDCGTCVRRQISYNDGDYFDLEDAAAEGLGLGFARLTGYEDALAYKSSDDDDQEDAVATGGRLPLRVLRGVWNRVRGNNQA